MRHGSGAPFSNRRDSRASQHSSAAKIEQQEIVEEEEESDEEEPELFFKDPSELLKMFHELEDQNLSLIQNGQDMEEAIEELKHQSKVYNLK